MQAINERGKLRLRLARGLLQGSPEAFGLPRGWKLDAPSDPYSRIMDTLKALAPEATKRLQEAVDWVEAYQGSQEPENTPKSPEKAPGGATGGETSPSRSAVSSSPFAALAAKSKSRERGG
jgi:hypothetical protein